MMKKTRNRSLLDEIAIKKPAPVDPENEITVNSYANYSKISERAARYRLAQLESDGVLESRIATNPKTKQHIRAWRKKIPS